MPFSNCIFALLLLPHFSALALSCTEDASRYFLKDGVLHFESYPPFNRQQVPDLDPGTFQMIHQEGYGSGPCSTKVNEYARDAKHVFYKGERMAGAAPSTFRILGNGYSTDGQAIFGNAKRITTRVNDFKTLGNFGIDGTAVFYKDRRLKGAGIENVMDIHWLYRTSTTVYDDKGNEVAADAATIRSLIPEHRITRDKSKVFFGSKAIPNADPDTFERIGNYFHRDKRAVYLDGREIPGLDPRTARQYPLQGIYTTDGKLVFKQYQRIDRDATTFTADMEAFYTKDKNGVYHNDVRIEGADTETFVTTALGHGQDVNYKFRHERPICARREGLKAEIPLCK